LRISEKWVFSSPTAIAFIVSVYTFLTTCQDRNGAVFRAKIAWQV